MLNGCYNGLRLDKSDYFYVISHIHWYITHARCDDFTDVLSLDITDGSDADKADVITEQVFAITYTQRLF